jgi:hypothetical protein
MEAPSEKRPLFNLSTLITLFTTDPTHWLNLALEVALWVREHVLDNRDMYEVEHLQVSLVLCDPQGKTAVYTKRQQVRFLQNNVIAYQDQAWGDGEIFAEYHCSPGVPVDRYREGHRYRVLISLRETKRRGDRADLMIDRTIRHGFTHPTEELQIEIDHVTRRFAVQVTFPSERFPKRVWWLEQKRGRSQPLEAFTQLPDGRCQVTQEVAKPRRNEAYIVRWRW